MKFSLNIAQYYSNVDFKSLGHQEIIKRIGLQLGAIEEVTDWAMKFDGIVVVNVVSCVKHPDADKLSLCLIDDGRVTENVDRDENGYVQVVCGANNVKADMFVAWIPPGATVPITLDSDPFVLEARLLRGKMSNGMLASPKELGISDEHEGILEITSDSIGEVPVPGSALSKYYGLDDLIIDCENKMFTHRPDCFGNLGIARELAGIFGSKFESPEWYTSIPVFSKANDIVLKVENGIEELVPRFTVVSMKNTKVNNSPVWMQSYLKRVGIKPINNIVDVTNYVMHVTGQPLHAFDYDKLQELSDSPSLMPRMAKAGEKLKLLGNKEITLDENDIVIATDKQAVALAGIMGGTYTEVDANTKNIVIECANFDMYSIRRSSMRHGLFTEAVTRFNKGQSPLQNDRVLAYAMKNLSEHAGAEQASNVYDLVSFDINNDNLNHVSTDINFINERLGTNLSVEDISSLLGNVEFSTSTHEQNIKVIAPFWRMDISIAEDIVEEVGRLYGFDKIEMDLPKKSIKPVELNPMRELKNELRFELSRLGANEVLTYSFVHANLLKNLGIDADKWSYHLRNALSPDLQYYRPALMPSLLSKVNMNLRSFSDQFDNEFAIFEIGKAHIKNVMEEVESGLPKQMNRLALVITADNKTARKRPGAAYYTAKKYLDKITNGQARYSDLDDFDNPFSAPYQNGRSAYVVLGDSKIGVIGEFNDSVKTNLKLPEYTAGFELDLDSLFFNSHTIHYSKLSNFPPTSQDVTFETTAITNWGDIYDFIDAELSVAGATDNFTHSIKPLAIYSPEESEIKRISFRISIVHHSKTLKTEELSNILDKISGALHEKYKTTRI